jgi:hypothetical protein
VKLRTRVLARLCASVVGGAGDNAKKGKRRAKGLLAFEEVRERVGDIGTPGRTVQVAIGCPCHHYPTRLHRWRTSAHLCTWRSQGPVHPHPVVGVDYLFIYYLFIHVSVFYLFEFKYLFSC